MCLSKPSAPKAPTVDPEAERRKAEAEAAANANEQLVADARRKRQQAGVLASDDVAAGSVLASGATSSTSKSTVLGAGGS